MRVIDLKLTYLCNNDCKYCCQDRRLRNTESSLSLKAIKKIVEEELAAGIDKVVLTGGEPTLNKEIFTIIKYLREKKINNIQLQTNGTLLNKKKIVEKYINLGITGFGISLHGCNSEMHEAFTSRKGSFNSLIEALNILKTYQLPITLNCVITKHNINFLENIVDFVARNEFASQLQFAFIHMTGKASFELKDFVSISEAAEAIKRAIANNTSSLKIFSEAIPFCLMYGHEKAVSELYNKSTTLIFDNKEKRNFTEAKLTTFKTKVEKCKLCIFYDICEGTWAEYPQIFGFNEFVPVTYFRRNYNEF